MPRRKGGSTKLPQQPPLPPNYGGQPPIPQPTMHGGKGGVFNYMHEHIMYLNQSKFFAGVVMIMLNIGSKFISVQFSKSAEQYFKLSVTKQILVFAMAWMGTRDIYTALVITAVFVVLSEHLFNEESKFCIVPHKYRVLDKLTDVLDTNGDGVVSEEEIKNAERILEKANKEKKKKEQKNALFKFDIERDNMNSD
jgi:hypothetical protein